MKVKQRWVCQNCRSRKLGCDGKHPECSQCLSRGRQCPGYPVNWNFVQSESKPAQDRRSPSKMPNRDHDSQEISQVNRPIKNLPSETSNKSPLHQAMTPPKPLPAEQVDLIIRNYVPDEELHSCGIIVKESQPRICGSWVEALPDITDHTSSHVVMAASNALASTIRSRKLPGGVSSIDSPRSYIAAIQAMRKALNAADKFLDQELLASIMCLSLAELMFAGPTDGVTMHANAIARILQANGPERYQTGVLHKLFIGFRPFLMIRALQDRTPSFLGSEEWKRTPFEIFCPSPMQSLLSQTAILPSLLQRMDVITSSRAHVQDEHEAVRLLNDISDFLHRLDEWEASVSNNATWPLYWYHDQNTGPSNVHATRAPSIWFTGISMANALTYIWSFRIICLYEMEHLACSLPQPSFDYLSVLGALRIESARQRAQSLMTRLCQSLEYFLQDEMKLFGPASAILPLQVSYAVAKMDAHHHYVELHIIRNVVDRLLCKGLRSFPLHIFEKNPFLHRWDTVEYGVWQTVDNSIQMTES